MNNIKEIKNKINELQKQIESYEKELAAHFDTELETLFASKVNAIEGYTLDSINVGINNHEFNDGDATYFSLHYEDLRLVFTDSIGEEVEIDGYSDHAIEDKAEKIREEIIELFELFDSGDFYESKFGDAYESIQFSLSKSGKLKID
jgi:hypothetical protein